MRFLLLLIVAVPLLMAFRTCGLFRDWLALRHWRRFGVAAGAPAPALTERVSFADGPDAVAAAAGRRLLSSALLTAAATCFAVAAGLGLALALGWA